MRAGRMKWRIIIEQPTATADAHGQPVNAWSTFINAWAEVMFKRGREYFTSDQHLPEADAIFKIYYIAGVTNKMRVVLNSTVYDIHSVNEIGYREGLEIIGKANPA